jgi:glycerophosphoryl diester phosphodiesterase
MPDVSASWSARDKVQPLLVVCILALVSLVIAFLGATPARVSAEELLGQTRAPGDAAFIASHRGGGASAPENTIPAIRAALAAGYGYVEVDIALTADGHAVLMHDATVDRTTDGSGVLASLTLDDVRSLDAGSWFHEEFAGITVPTLEEVLALLVAYDGRAILEMKGEWDAAATAAAVDAVEDAGLERDVVMASFDATNLAAVAAITDSISRLLILKHIPDDVVTAVAEAQVPGIIVSADAVKDRPEVVDELHAHGRRVVVYTLNHDRQWAEMTELGVDGIVTDDPTALSQWQRASAQSE